MAYKEQYPSALLSDAVEAIGSLPGVGHRSALRLALHLLRQPEENVHHFTDAINRLRDGVQYCKCCHNISDSEICSICSDPGRNHNQICVVENVRDVMSIEATNQYFGLYHVLGGIISPLNGIGPADLTVKELVDRISALENPAECEVILALSGDVDGDTTSYFICKQIASSGVRITTLARGLGFGDDLEYADQLTLGRSIVNRQEFKY
jgi:recombination protein RecR